MNDNSNSVSPKCHGSETVGSLLDCYKVVLMIGILEPTSNQVILVVGSVGKMEK